METVHRSVLLHESIELLQIRPGSVVVDCTLGGAGFAEAALEVLTPGGRLLGIDRDAEAVERARARLARFGAAFIATNRPFSELSEAIGEASIGPPDAIMMDLGLSSDQLDEAQRGFSFQQDGPLDMRMDRRDGRTAADVVNRTRVEELADLIYRYGEERHSRRIARAIVRERDREPITTTGRLAAIVRRAVPPARGPRRIDTATRTFMAIRIAVNDEITELETGLEQATQALSPGGRIGVISFHSLEDSTVKNAFNVAAKSCICPPRQPVCTCAHRATLRTITPRPLRAAPGEVHANPRARSARMRVAEKLGPETSEPSKQFQETSKP
ncbi:MAG: 16S rRNA (cytosine(1402)-N(4))-methyltransferase RsmH [Candidatus Dormibacteria bacterium]